MPETTSKEQQSTARHSTGHQSYLEHWARRYWRSQETVERDRLRKGKAVHRAHRKPITGKRAGQ